MKKTVHTIFTAFLLICSTAAYADPLRITTTQISPGEALSTKKYKHLAATSPGQYKTLVFFENAQEGEPYSITIDRVIMKDMKVPGTKVMHWAYIGAGLNEVEGLNSPFFTISSQGYIPGEPVVVEVKNYDQTFKHSFRCIPYPVQKTSKIDYAVVRAEIADFIGGIYKITFDDFKNGEDVQTVSFSEGEEIKSSKKIVPGAATYVMPAVEGKKGGMEIFTVKRKDGEKLTIAFPWGTNMLPFLNFNLRPKAYGSFIN